MISVLSACNLGNGAANQANQSDAATTAPDLVATSAPAASSDPTPIPAMVQPAAAPTIKQTNTAKTTVVNTAAPKQPSVVTNSKPPTPTLAPAATTSSQKQGDDLEQQINQLLNNLDNADTVNDAGK